MPSRLRSSLLLAAVAIAGIIGSALVFFAALQREEVRITEATNLRADWRAADLSWKLESLASPVVGMASVLSAQETIDVHGLQWINAWQAENFEALRAVVWAPWVALDRRPSFEAEMRQAGLAGFRIVEPAGEVGTFRPAPSRLDYAPIVHAWVFDGPAAQIGQDVLFDPRSREAALAARDSGRITVSQPISSALNNVPFIVLTAPVYGPGGVPTSVSERRTKLRGFVRGTVPLVPALERAVADTPGIIEDLYLTLGKSAPDGLPVAFAIYSAKDRDFRAVNRSIDPSQLPGTVVVRPIEVRNAQWLALFHFPPDVTGAMKSADKWIWLAAGLLGTALVFGFLAIESRRARVSERELVSERQINQRIFETSLDLILVVSRKGQFLKVSPSSLALLGHRPEDMVGRSAVEFIHPDDLDSTRDEMRQARRGRLVRNFECRYIHQDGRAVQLAWMGVWSDEEQRHFFIGRDTTELKAVESQLRQAQKMEAIGQLSGGIAHDFNNMLGAIIGNLELAADEKRDIARIHRFVQSATGVALRGAELVQRLLAFARRQMLVPKLIDVAAAVDGMVPLLRRTLGETIEMRQRREPGTWPVLADQAQLESAVLNLAINARDAMPRGGTLTISISNLTIDQDLASTYPEIRPGDYVALSVADTGSGMTSEIQARVFEPFFTTKQAGKGTGLGLSMVYGFLRQSGGTAKIYSEVGHGTTVNLYFPRAHGAAAAANEQPRVDAAPPRGTERILLVEDHPEIREVTVSQLAELGYRVTQASNAAQALQLLANGTEADLLFSDIVMPGMSGIELAQEVRRRIPGMKVLLTSGFASPIAVRDQAKDFGFDLLAKPYRKATLAARIRAALDGTTVALD